MDTLAAVEDPLPNTVSTSPTGTMVTEKTAVSRAPTQFFEAQTTTVGDAGQSTRVHVSFSVDTTS